MGGGEDIFESRFYRSSSGMNSTSPKKVYPHPFRSLRSRSSTLTPYSGVDHMEVPGLTYGKTSRKVQRQNSNLALNSMYCFPFLNLS